MDHFIAALLAIIGLYLFGYGAYCLFLMGKEIYQSRKFEETEPTLEDRIERFKALSNKAHPKPGIKKANGHKKTLPTPSHLTEFSKVENVTIAWEREGDQLKTTYFKQS